MQESQTGDKEVRHLAVTSGARDPSQAILLHTLLARQVGHICRLSDLVSDLRTSCPSLLPHVNVAALVVSGMFVV